jgi:hypothetical protein
MYRSKDARQYELENFYLPFGGHLDPKNRWVQLSQLIPWEEFEQQYVIIGAKLQEITGMKLQTPA